MPGDHRGGVKAKRSSLASGSAFLAILSRGGRRVVLPWFAPLAALLAGCAHGPDSTTDPLARYQALMKRLDTEIHRVETMDCRAGDWKCAARIIAAREHLDQMVRNPAIIRGNCLGRLGFADHRGCHMGHMSRVDESNRRFLEAFVARHGSPFCSPLPPSAQRNFWYLLQHLDADPAALSVRMKLSESIRCALHDGIISPWQYAAFVDRLRLMEHKPQLYGTQFACTQSGAQLLPAIPEEDMRANRKRVGMQETLAETRRRVARRCDGSR